MNNIEVRIKKLAGNGGYVSLTYGPSPDGDYKWLITCFNAQEPDTLVKIAETIEDCLTKAEAEVEQRGWNDKANTPPKVSVSMGSYKV